MSLAATLGWGGERLPRAEVFGSGPPLRAMPSLRHFPPTSLAAMLSSLPERWHTLQYQADAPQDTAAVTQGAQCGAWLPNAAHGVIKCSLRGPFPAAAG